jgi:hypothetical protein
LLLKRNTSPPIDSKKKEFEQDCALIVYHVTLTNGEIGGMRHGDENNVARMVPGHNKVAQHTQRQNVFRLIYGSSSHPVNGGARVGRTGKLASQCHGHGVARPIRGAKNAGIAREDAIVDKVKI